MPASVISRRSRALTRAVAAGAIPRPALRAIARMDRVVLVLALVVVYLGLAVSRA